MSKATAAYTTTLRRVMWRAWTLARFGAQRHGGKARAYFAQALRQAWQDVKASVRAAAESQARVLAEVERMKAERAFAGPALPPRPIRCRVGAPARAAYRFPSQGGLAL